jgi:hypothetical protein
MNTMGSPLYRLTFDAAELLRDHPPRLRHPHKRALLELAYPGGRSPAGEVEVTRWPQAVPASFALPASLAADVRPDFYDYAPVATPAVEWHVNFADPHLFYAYGGGLFAQDEMQVAEHPILGSVREALLARGLAAETVAGREATPVLVRNVERRLAVATDVNAAAGRPQGLYGNRFSRAPWDAVRRATRVFDPPTRTNLIAMAAPSGGQGAYSVGEIASVFATAHTAFAAAVAESAGCPVIVHTGFWGCGAFGGNRRLMTALQALAARSAGVARLVVHAGDVAGAEEAQRGLDLADAVAYRCGSPCSPGDVSNRLATLEFRWGVSDGN